ncbi:CehA/McbA family metallohydrolase [Microbacterium sp.]|uniref:CehA/McbA family metallohydrolase n=1 Tax=Microbacterium sp. TaxID=51671 RepID=UPI00281156CD|nr:CehA/McbA family metallohydrolase [Microbacterium sp.]
MSIIRTTVRLTHELQNEDRYVRVPFDVPSGTDTLEVRISYDTEKAVIDLGCEGAAGWRGWSGGARRAFVIRTDDATPGYLPGRPEEGEWNVILGIHRLSDAGADVIVEILRPAESMIDHGPTASPTTGSARGSTRNLPAPEGLRWFAGDFHAHTLHSDGRESISGLAALAARAGLDFLAVTDHNTISHHPHLPVIGAQQDITLLPGQEVTTHRGHANAFGDIGWIDFRLPAQDWVDEVDSRGGVLSVNHPISGDCSWLHPLSRAPRAIELWHSTWYHELIATSPLAFHARWDRDAVLLGGADFHIRDQGVGPGTPTTWVAAEDASPDAILAGVAAGRTAIMGGVRVEDGLTVPDVFTAPVLVRIEGDVIATDADGTILVDGEGRRRSVRDDLSVFEADPAAGPYYLLHPDRRIAALCA